jgi:DNA-binding LacI/PurR family transcriptional regulator
VRVGLKEIAKLAGVSVATVSNVVNGYRPVTETTRRRVQRAIEELGYSPNVSARHLRRGRTGIIALAIPELTNPYFAELAEVTFRVASALDYTVLLDHTEGDRETELMLTQGTRAQVIDGLILSPVQLDRADLLERTNTTPMVLIGERVYGVSYDHIAIDNLAASIAATEHLLSLGRRRIAFVGAQSDVNRQPAHLRLEGYRQAIERAGLAFDPALVVITAQFGREDGAQGLRQLMELPERPDAVFAYNDLIAVGVLRAAADLGLKVPADLAVAGFDDIEEGRYSTPALTTVSPDKDLLGRTAVTSLIGRLEGTCTDEPREIPVPFALVVRESTVGLIG